MERVNNRGTRQLGACSRSMGRSEGTTPPPSPLFLQLAFSASVFINCFFSISLQCLKKRHSVSRQSQTTECICASPLLLQPVQAYTPPPPPNLSHTSLIVLHQTPTHPVLALWQRAEQRSRVFAKKKKCPALYQGRRAALAHLVPVIAPKSLVALSN